MLAVISLVGIGGGIAYGNAIISILSIIGVFIFMGLGFYIKNKASAGNK
ncbi:DUF5325 family protein [Terrilactibacillus sp. S3-3]|nr:DUF5325 family protein [Terrilactibacillus sp. S3-3]